MPFRRPSRTRIENERSASAPTGVPEDPLQHALIARCLANEEGAWEEFLHLYRRLIYATILKVGLPIEEQEEAFQETIAGIYRQLGRLRQQDRLIPWIVGIAWRQSVNRIRSRVRGSRMVELDEATLPESVGPPNPDRPPDEARAGLEQAQQAREALESLPDRCRRLLGYFFYEDPPPDYSEISRREGVPIGSLGPTRARCLEKMRAYFEKRGWV
jgi:RNA polymerase sigma factor (sigma-70 family)